MKTTRRTFIRQSGKILAAGSLLSTFPAVLPARHRGVAPSDQLNIGVIGCRGRGFRVLQQHLDLGGVNAVALCDVDQRVLDEKSKALQEGYGQKAKQYTDYRKMLEQSDIDAVIIGTPDHWHCLQTVDACAAGKDVYVEKPMANTIEECNLMVAAAKKYNRIVQVGQQQRSGKVWNEVMDFIKAGKLGNVRKANIWANFNYGLGPEKRPDTPVPDGVNYDSYLGPAPEHPFNPSRFHGGWRFFWDYGGGLMTDWGVHLIDMALWAKDITRPPESVMAYGARLNRPELARQTFDTMTAVYPYDDYIIQWEHSAGKQVGPYNRLYGIAFLGDKGTLVADRSGWEVLPEWDNEAKAHKMEAVEKQKSNPGHNLHIRNFVDCVKSREIPVCPPEVGRTVAVCAHMANIAVRTGAHYLEWNDDRNRFAGSKAANRLVTPGYRKPWKLPQV